MTPEAVEAFFATLAAANPRPQTELEFTSVFELLVAVLLSAQATDVSVNKATKALFALAPTPPDSPICRRRRRHSTVHRPNA